MLNWYPGFCVGLSALALLVALVCIYAAIYHSGTISQAEEEHEQ